MGDQVQLIVIIHGREVHHDCYICYGMALIARSCTIERPKPPQFPHIYTIQSVDCSIIAYVKQLPSPCLYSSLFRYIKKKQRLLRVKLDHFTRQWETPSSGWRKASASKTTYLSADRKQAGRWAMLIIPSVQRATYHG